VAGGIRLNLAARDGLHGPAWLALAALLGGGSMLAWWLPAAAFDWQPTLAAAQPWRAWSAAFVHWSPLHLGANLAGAAVVAALGHAARLPARAAAAWFAAWPLTQAGLLLRPELAHYGGLSGVLHAGVAVAALWLLVAPPERVLDLDLDPAVASAATHACNGHGPGRLQRRLVGAGIAAGLLAKLLIEAPWGPLLHHTADWDIAVAPLAHATGAAAGLACAAVACAWPAKAAVPRPPAP
jgi:hypothetical protein